MTIHAVFPSVVVNSRHSASWLVWTRKTVDIPVPVHSFRPGQVPTASLLPEAVVLCIAPAPSVVHPPVPVVESIAPVPAVFLVARPHGQVSTARRGAASSTARRGAHVRGGGGPGSVPGQSSTARDRADNRWFVGRLFILPDSRGFIERSAEAEFRQSAFCFF